MAMDQTAERLTMSNTETTLHPTLHFYRQE